MAAKPNKKPIYESQQSLYEKALLKMNADQVIVQHAYKIENYNIAAAMFEEVGEYLDAPQLAEQCRALARESAEDEIKEKYARCRDNMAAAADPDKRGKLIKALESLGEYEDAPSMLEQCRRLERAQKKKKRLRRRIAGGAAVLLAAGIVAAGVSGLFRYMTGLGYRKLDKPDKAAAIFESMPGFLNAERHLREMQAEEYQKAKKGSYINFGDFRWLVLAADEQTLTAMTVDVNEKHLFAAVPFNDRGDGASWKDSSLREWLNGAVYEEHFSDREKEAILRWENGPTVNPDYGTGDEQSTQDYLSVLSVEEAQPYMAALRTMGRDFWFRTPGMEEGTFCFMSGGVHALRTSGYPAKEAKVAVRPVVRLDRSKL